MSKLNKEIAIFIVFLLLIIVFWGIFIKTPDDTKTSVDTKTPDDSETPVQEARVAGLFIEFEYGITEQEIKVILENYSMPRNYNIDYDSDIMPKRYYITVDQNKRKDIEDELRKKENWTDPVFPNFKKGNNYIITVTEQAIEDKSFLELMEKNNLQVKSSFLCYIHFGDGSNNWSDPKNWIMGKDAIRIKNDLETNEKVLLVIPDYIEG